MSRFAPKIDQHLMDAGWTAVGGQPHVYTVWWSPDGQTEIVEPLDPWRGDYGGMLDRAWRIFESVSR